ncbi:MAG: Phytochrome, two-component sensor histidine kinase [uncultured Gemmatimonadetes bacterium]|uniref:histidine kinase n=1 Tax=uncultured Gemmatimonadota bacterium TaxID=203437 RepID=A0A6J4KS61_9BACT|nr:MAG: Phytochrome, two-component sensor histidine kinase [uncultured Gemmatimonadota bacterium]
MEDASILVVDDEMANLHLLEEFLKFDGFGNVALTTDPRRVPEMFEERRPDILLLDLHMPHLDGFSVMRQLRSTLPPGDYFPILVLTADVTSETKLRALSEGASDFLTKPLDAVEVVLRIRNLLATRFLHLQERAARARAEAAGTRAAYLAEASRVLSSSFDYRTMLSTVARLAVPKLADYVVVELADAEGRPERVAYAHADPEMEALLAGEVGLWGGAIPRGHPLVRGCTEGQFVLVSDVASALGEDAGDDEAQRSLLRTLAPRSVASVPLAAAGEVLGDVTLVTSTSGRTLDSDDLALAEELARRVMVAVEHAQLYHDALQATRARDEILGVVAHDLRNPLSTVRMAAQLLADDVAPAHRKPLDTLLRTTERMNQLIQDLLEVTRIESGKLALELHTESAGGVLREAVAMLAPLAQARSITFDAQLPADLPRVPLDAARILQVISNLVGNALKFTPAGGRVTLGAEVIPGEVRVSVADTGPGIPADQIPRVFGRFWQAGKSDRRGIGLGLSIARGIVEGHGGRIWVESVEGQGATFFFTIPS